jgi:enterochelin esterase-like enzyme
MDEEALGEGNSPLKWIVSMLTRLIQRSAGVVQDAIECREGVEPRRHVMLDARCPNGHHVFADSENNGPYETAFVEEFLPAFEQSYRAVRERRGRFLTGHSSGAWSGLWLQLNHPQTFAMPGTR